MEKSLQDYLQEWKHSARAIRFESKSMYSKDAIEESKIRGFNIDLYYYGINSSLGPSIIINNTCTTAIIRGVKYNMDQENSDFFSAVFNELSTLNEALEKTKFKEAPDYEKVTISQSISENAATAIALMYIYGIYFDNKQVMNDSAKMAVEISEKLKDVPQVLIPKYLFNVQFDDDSMHVENTYLNGGFHICNLSYELGDVMDDILYPLDTYADINNYFSEISRSYALGGYVFSAAMHYDTEQLDMAINAVKAAYPDDENHNKYHCISMDNLYYTPDALLINAILTGTGTEEIKDTLDMLQKHYCLYPFHDYSTTLLLSVQKGRKDILKLLPSSKLMLDRECPFFLMSEAATNFANKHGWTDEIVTDDVIAYMNKNTTMPDNICKMVKSSCRIFVPNDIISYAAGYTNMKSNLYDTFVYNNKDIKWIAKKAELEIKGKTREEK